MNGSRTCVGWRSPWPEGERACSVFGCSAGLLLSARRESVGCLRVPRCLPSAAVPSTLLILMSYIIAKNIKPEAALTSICKVTLSIKGMADKCHHIAASQTAFLFLLLFISAVVIAAASLGPVSGSQISALAGTLRVQPGPLSLPKVAYFDQE